MYIDNWIVVADIVTTVGMHPTRCMNFENGETIDGTLLKEDDLLNKMKELINDNRDKIVAIGECGLGNIIILISYIILFYY